MSGQRPERVQEALRIEISKIVQHELRDPRLGFITITKVELTKDLRYARVFFTVLGEAKVRYKALKGLRSATGYIKGLVADRVKLRCVPEIVFKIDDGIIRVQQIYSILEKLKDGSRNTEGVGGDQKA